MPASTSEPTTPTRVRAVADALVVAAPDITAADLAAASDALLWAQAAARVVDRDPSTRGYFDAMTQELGRVAWTVVEATDIHYEADGRDVTPAAIVDAVLGPAGAATRRLLAAMQAGVSADADAVLRFWWAGTQALTETTFWVGPLRRDRNGVVTASFAWLDLQFQDSAWRSLFVARRAQSLAVKARRLTMTLNSALWAGLAPVLEQRLADKIRDAVRDVDIDL